MKEINSAKSDKLNAAFKYTDPAPCSLKFSFTHVFVCLTAWHRTPCACTSHMLSPLCSGGGCLPYTYMVGCHTLTLLVVIHLNPLPYTLNPKPSSLCSKACTSWFRSSGWGVSGERSGGACFTVFASVWCNTGWIALGGCGSEDRIGYKHAVQT